MDRFEIYRRILALNGSLVQEVVAMEEMAELTKEISKMIRGESNRSHIVEEMADVRIMLEQLMLILGISEEEIAKEMDFKAARLNGRMM